MMLRPIAFVAIIAMGAVALGFAARADALSQIAEKGEIVVGVNTGFQPFGFLDDGGKPVGLEIDLAKSIADWLGVKARLQTGAAGNRVPWLRQGRIDMIPASMPASPAARAAIGGS